MVKSQSTKLQIMVEKTLQRRPKIVQHKHQYRKVLRHLSGKQKMWIDKGQTIHNPKEKGQWSVNTTQKIRDWATQTLLKTIHDLSPGLYLDKHYMCHQWSRNSLPFRSTCVHPHPISYEGTLYQGNSKMNRINWERYTPYVVLVVWCHI